MKYLNKKLLNLFILGLEAKLTDFIKVKSKPTSSSPKKSRNQSKSKEAMREKTLKGIQLR